MFILAFDHRSSFSKNILGLSGEPDEQQTRQIQDFKHVIFEGFKLGINLGVPKETAAILTDEQFGGRVLTDAKDGGYIFAVCTEKSGQKEFMFEHGEDFGKHLQGLQPTFAKALVRYNPEDPDSEMNQRQLQTLKKLSDYCHANNLGFLIEPLIPATPSQLEKVSGDQKRYDLELRPGLMVEMVKQMQEGGVEPDVWKIEGLEETAEYEAVIKQAKSQGREHVVAVILGRGADNAQVEKWLLAAAKAEGMVGFAIGRSIFHEALMALKEGQINREEAVSRIAKNYLHFYKVFNKK